MAENFPYPSLLNNAEVDIVCNIIIEPFSPTKEIEAEGHYDKISPYGVDVDVDGIGVSARCRLPCGDDGSKHRLWLQFGGQTRNSVHLLP